MINQNGELTITVVTKRCHHCGLPGHLPVPVAGYDAWKAGALIQVALPTVPANEREQLISGTHPACWTAMFGEGD